MCDRVTGEPTHGRRATDGGGEPLLGRRRMLRAGVAVGAGAALVWGLGADREGSAGRTDIVYAMARSEPGSSGPLRARTRVVPADWHENTRRAFAVQEELRGTELPSLLAAFAVPGSYDDPAASIAVQAADEGIRETLESVSGDLAIDLDVLEEVPPSPGRQPTVSEAYQAPDLDRRRVPGGFVCDAKDTFGTLAPALFDEEGERYFATSNHLYGAGGGKETEHGGEPLSLRNGEGTRPVGRVVRGYPLADLVRVDPVDGYRPVPGLARASSRAVVGQYTRAGLADLMARNEPLEKVGAFSDHTSGQIKGVDGITCYVGEICKQGQLRWGDERTITDGDSGSVNFHADPEHPEEHVLVGGINNARTWWPGADFTWGTAAHHLLDEYGLHF